MEVIINTKQAKTTTLSIQETSSMPKNQSNNKNNIINKTDHLSHKNQLQAQKMNVNTFIITNQSS